MSLTKKHCQEILWICDSNQIHAKNTILFQFKCILLFQDWIDFSSYLNFLSSHYQIFMNVKHIVVTLKQDFKCHSNFFALFIDILLDIFLRDQYVCFFTAMKKTKFCNSDIFLWFTVSRLMIWNGLFTIFYRSFTSDWLFYFH